MFDAAESLVADLLKDPTGGASSFDAVQLPSFPSGYLSFAAETYLRCDLACPACVLDAILEWTSSETPGCNCSIACRDSIYLSGALNGTHKGDTIVIIRCVVAKQFLVRN